MAKVIVAYVPVPHQGYLDFFDRHPDARRIFVLSRELTGEFRALQKDLRALSPHEAAKMLSCIYGYRMGVIGRVGLEDLGAGGGTVVMPDEDVSHSLAEKYLYRARVLFEPTFLRWDQKRTLAQSEVPADKTMSMAEQPFLAELARRAEEAARHSHDWWRQVGAVAMKEGEILPAAHNRHIPTEFDLYAAGDPRANFKKGEHFDLSTILHAEAGVVAEAARRVLEGTELFVTDFPCPACAKLVAAVGISRLYFVKGYAVLDGAEVLRKHGVEIVRVVP